MKRTFEVTVKFNTKNEKVIECITREFDPGTADENGIAKMRYTGNINSKSDPNASVERGMKHRLNFWNELKRNYTIIDINEIG